jgi:hypothetical protein
MISRWVILEDVTERALNIVNAIHTLDQTAKIDWLACCKPLKALADEYRADFLPSGTDIMIFDEIEPVVSYFAHLPSAPPVIFVVDIILEGVHSERDEWLSSELTTYLQRSSNSLVVVSSSKASISQFYQRFSEDTKPRVIAGDFRDLPELENRSEAAHSFVIGARQQWNLRFGDELETMWSATDDAQWFSDTNDSHSASLPHDWTDPARLTSHQSIVSKIEFFQWCPDFWWKDCDSVYWLNENLKCLCGTTFCESRNLSVGATWLLAGAAWQSEHGDKTPLIPNPFVGNTSAKFWAMRPEATRKVLPMQTREHSKECIKELYSFFRQIFVFRSQAGGASLNGKSAVREAILEPPGYSLRIIFNWNVGELMKRITVSRVGLASEGSSSRPLTSFLNQRQIGTGGVGARSSFWIESNSITICGADE